MDYEIFDLGDVKLQRDIAKVENLVIHGGSR